MKSIFPLLLLATLLATGCSTIDSRIKEKTKVFATFDSTTQEKLRKGLVEIGYTPEQVYIALGKPDRKRERLTAKSQELIWTYQSYHEDYQGTAVAGYRRVIGYNPVSRRSYVYWEPALVDVYRRHSEDRIRIIFRADKVAVIEQAKD